MKDYLEGLTPRQLGKLRTDWLRCVPHIANESDPQPKNFMELIGQVGKVSDALRVLLLLTRCYHLVIPILTDDGKPVALDDVLSRFAPALAELHDRVPLPAEACPKCGAKQTRLFRQFGLGGRPEPEWSLAQDLGYAVFKNSCLSFGALNRLCGSCNHVWLSHFDEDSIPILEYARKRIAAGEPWSRYLEQDRADSGNCPYSALLQLIRKPISRGFPEVQRLVSDAHDLSVSLLDSDSQPRPMDVVKEDVNRAEKALHEKYPQPTDKCPKCGSPGIVRFTGYPGPALCAAERLGYAGSSGCIGSSTRESRMCTSWLCRTRWQSSIPYELTIFEYLNKLYPMRSNSTTSPGDTWDFSKMEPIGTCPHCGDNVYEFEMHYGCRRQFIDHDACGFRVGKTILQQPISLEDIRQLLSEGRTGFLDGFVSNRTKRRFTAALVLSPDEKKVRLEFDEKTKAKVERAKKRREAAHK
jgi:hypothetical protein